MTDDKRAEDGGRLFFKSEIFKDGPGAGNLSDTIGAEQGIEFFGGETRRQKRPRPARTRVCVRWCAPTIMASTTRSSRSNT